MTTYTCAEEDITEAKERSGGGGHWGDKETKVDKLKYRSFLSLSCVFIFNESSDSFYVNFSSVYIPLSLFLFLVYISSMNLLIRVRLFS